MSAAGTRSDRGAAPLQQTPLSVSLDQDVIAALPELDEAIRAFVPVPGPAGESVAEWLSERALREPQEATVRARLSHASITGIYALCAAQVALGTEDRAQLGGVHYRTQPAILLAQFARAADTPGIGGELLEHAARTAQLALHYVGATVLVVDPFDEDTSSYWREHWGFYGGFTLRVYRHAMRRDPAAKVRLRTLVGGTDWPAMSNGDNSTAQAPWGELAVTGRPSLGSAR